MTLHEMWLRAQELLKQTEGKEICKDKKKKDLATSCYVCQVTEGKYRLVYIATGRQACKCKDAGSVLSATRAVPVSRLKQWHARREKQFHNLVCCLLNELLGGGGYYVQGPAWKSDVFTLELVKNPSEFLAGPLYAVSRTYSLSSHDHEPKPTRVI
jgi:hypothetical protein